MQLGFVIDHSRCIGCHACTVACKSENDVPLGNFRTWVKYTESGDFPDVRRDFAVLRCNQCSKPPCVDICPVSALAKDASGIIDVDPKACIGCKACMHGCPYDALYINPEKGTAEKCHFCAHRAEMGLAPACAVVCPTEAIIPGDFDDPDSRVSRLKAQGLANGEGLTARKWEAGTMPNVLYVDVAAAGVDPNRTNNAGGYLWAQNPSGPIADAQKFEARHEAAHVQAEARVARTTYDVPRDLLWGWKITGYLWAKSIAAGALPAAALAALFSIGLALPGRVLHGLPSLVSLLALGVTGGLLVADLKRPERFWYILVRPNWKSWLARGTYVIVFYSAFLLAGLARHAFGGGTSVAWTWVLVVPSLALGGLTAAYTGFLFTQAKGRVLWMKRGYWLQLVGQALLAGAATLLVLAPLLGSSADLVPGLRIVLALGIAAELAFHFLEPRLAPKGREREYERAVLLLHEGPMSRRHAWLGLGLGLVAPLVLVLVGGPALYVAGVAALAGLWVREDTFVAVGQTLPIS